MKADEDSHDVPGYVTPLQAAEMIGVTDQRVYDYIQEGRLKYKRISRTYLISIESVEQFKRQPVGRARKQPPPWRVYRSAITLQSTSMQVQIRAGQEAAFKKKLQGLREKQEHLLTGSMQRYIQQDERDPSTIQIWLVWKDNELPDEQTRERELAAFKAAFADVLDWETERESSLKGLLYT
ncbi:MAG TPA: helix-turn-helix domain-containing protein [Ktedonosporobacter sp.]|nr:helix-turn-helix domain-containing protein [Ktedonosporobacter sp.]